MPWLQLTPMTLWNVPYSVQKKEKPLVDGLSGRNALEIAMKIQNKIIEDKNGYQKPVL